MQDLTEKLRWTRPLRVLVAGLTAIALANCLMCLSAIRGPDPLKLVQEGRPIVQAILRYKGEWGRYPARLADLVPKYLASVQGWEWGYGTGWDREHDVEVFHLGGGNRNRSVHYESGRGWFSRTGEGSSELELIAPPEPEAGGKANPEGAPRR